MIHATSMALLRSLTRSLAALSLLVAMTGCSSFHPIYTPMGDVLASYSEANATPYTMQMWDSRMACTQGEALDPLVYSFTRVTAAPDETGSLLMELAANCSELEAWEAELDYLRADYSGDIPAAKDARERSKRFNGETAKRRYVAFQRAMAAYSYDPADEAAQCPVFIEERDELTFLLGLLTGLQAIVNDANSGSLAGVPRNIAPQAERAAQCVDNEKWGGIPHALQAMVWLLIPDTRPDQSPDPWVVFDRSSQLGVDAGIRASMALQVVAAETFGRKDVLATVIARFVEAEETIDVWDDYRLVDTVAGDVIEFSSDKYWTANYGHRTPPNRFGSLTEQDEAGSVEVMDLDGLL